MLDLSPELPPNWALGESRMRRQGGPAGFVYLFFLRSIFINRRGLDLIVFAPNKKKTKKTQEATQQTNSGSQSALGNEFQRIGAPCSLS